MTALRAASRHRLLVVTCLLAPLLAGCQASAPPRQPVDQRAIAAVGEGAAVKRSINLAAGKAHGEQRITDAQLGDVETAAEDMEARLVATRAQLRAYLTSDTPDAGALEASLVRLKTARAHLVAVADGLAVKWRTAP